MKTSHITYPVQWQDEQRIVIALGFFDGIHLGHQAVLNEAKQLAQQLDAEAAVMTFSPHPREVVGKAKDLRFMTPLPEKLQLFEKLGIEHAYVMKFDPSFSKLGADEFVEKILIPLGVIGVATGFNYRFGRFAAGTPKDLERLGKDRFIARMVEPVLVENEPVSSTRVRAAIMEGKVELAQQMLGRPYQICGTVVHGDKRGRLMGFPTANLQCLFPYFPPKRGVYVVRIRVHDESYLGIMNIGIRPTFSDPVPRERYEVHLLDFQGNLYDQLVKVEFLHYLREEQKFPSMEHLTAQLHQDREQARSWIRTHITSSVSL